MIVEEEGAVPKQPDGVGVIGRTEWTDLLEGDCIPVPLSEAPLIWEPYRKNYVPLTLYEFGTPQWFAAIQSPSSYAWHSRPPECDEYVVRWDDDTGGWLDLNQPGQLEQFQGLIKGVKLQTLPQIAAFIEANFTVHCVTCEDEEPVKGDCCEDQFNNTATNIGLTIGLVLAIVIERIEWNKKKRGLENNYPQAVALVGFVLFLVILVGNASGWMLVIGAIVFTGLTIIMGRDANSYALVKETSFVRPDPDKLTLYA